MFYIISFISLYLGHKAHSLFCHFFFWFISLIFINRSSSGSSRRESPSVLSSKENEKKLHGEKMDSFIDEQVQTAADDSLRSDSVPSLPDEKGNFPCTDIHIYI